MVQPSTLLMIGLGFTLGLTLGLLLQLPGVSSPYHARGRRDLSSGDMNQPGVLPSYRPSPGPLDSTATHIGEQPINMENNSDPSLIGQNGHVPKIPSENNPLQAVKSKSKQTSGQNHQKQGVSTLQVKIRQTKNTIESLKEQHGWNSSKSHDKYDNKKMGSIASHRHVGGKDDKDRSNLQIKTVSTNRQHFSSRTVSTYIRSSHEDKKSPSSSDLSNLSENNSQPSYKSEYLSDSNSHQPFTNRQDLTPKDGKLNQVKENLNHEVTNHTMTPIPKSHLNNVNLFNGIYWNEVAEMLVPNSFTSDDAKEWRNKVETLTISAMREGCGRQQNRQLQFSDGSLACARYRINRDQIQGEIFSYYLAQLLGIQNVPPPVLALPDPSNPRWAGILDELISAQWNQDKTVVLTPWIEGLQPVYIPNELRPKSRKLHPDPSITKDRTKQELTELIQWSDLIVLDYLTGNVDRAVNNLYNLQWNSDMMSAPAHNLEKQGHSGPLVFLDNESGLFHSYRLLDKYADYHESFLQALCIFRRSTAESVKRLAKDGQVAGELAGIFSQMEPLHTHLPLPRSTNMAILQTRLQKVVNQIEHCDKLYNERQNLVRF